MMAASYDGRLTVSKDGISACCRAMDICALRKQIYVSSKGVMMLRSTDNPKLGMGICCCPFCGARPEGSA